MKHEMQSQATKQALVDSLKQLLTKKSFSKITVTEIVENCGYNRKTFYYHFEDIYSLLRWMLEQDLLSVVDSNELTSDPEKVIRFALSYIKQNRQLLTCVITELGHDELRNFLYDDFAAPIRMVIQKTESEIGLTLDDAYREYLTSFYTSGMTGMIIRVLLRKISSEDEFIEDMITTFHVSLTALVQARGHRM
ncbi:TetR/AcrR family transcriptional regulator C-terminal domain-containing protein [Laedolimicola intestinihominis]|uniref:TetR/AcrR family transcriptional regulator C-terminal domain-containing protein n=1 Tax=Laedolimicola intestinihominis TaxID=3133166 RepID=A0ABV1FDT5_9FIRM